MSKTGDNHLPKNILLTGLPGIGKTNVVMRLAEHLSNKKIAGFYTEEIRVNDQREGFRAVTFSCHTAVLAHVRLPHRSRVGRYGVDVRAFEELVLSELVAACDVMLIDEIGKMECLSARFVDAVRAVLDGPAPVVGTVAAKGSGFISEVKARPDIDLQEVTVINRHLLPQQIAARLESLQLKNR